MALITPATQLPTELWQIISDSCPRSTQRTLLSVSSRLHDIAVRSVFAHTRLVFGVKRRAVRTVTGHSAQDVARSKDDFSRSLAILEHFATCPSFANVVHTLTVRWRDFLDSEGENSDVALAALHVGIQALSSLETFCWYGHGARTTFSLPNLIATALAKHCPNLRMLRATISQKQPENFALLPTTKLALILVDSERVGIAYPVPGVNRQVVSAAPTVRKIIETHAASIEELVVRVALPTDCPLPALKSYSLWLNDDINFTSTIVQSDHLTSLALTSRYSGSPAVCAALQAGIAAFPRLSSFQLYISSQRVPNRGTIICKFLQSKKQLRRLRVQADPRVDTSFLDDAMSAVPELPRLEVLRYGAIDESNRQFYQDNLPVDLAILCLSFAKEMEEGSEVQIVMDLIARLPKLRMLHLTRYAPFQDRKMVNVLTRSDVSQMVELLCLPVGTLGSETMLQLGRRRKTVPLCSCMTGGDRIFPGECELLDDWIWAATLSPCYRARLSLEIPECQSCGAAETSCPFGDRYDLSFLEGIYHDLGLLSGLQY
ncbi:hypothetical protein C8Q74DRAFT_557670 [Fomes fomentarius]|nr:hypothetical protein C8Q74DRAFT_557670 [Fomes fomentarius]